MVYHANANAIRIDTTIVIASEAKQSSSCPRTKSGLLRFARN